MKIEDVSVPKSPPERSIKPLFMAKSARRSRLVFRIEQQRIGRSTRDTTVGFV